MNWRTGYSPAAGSQPGFGVLVLFVPWGRDALAKASEGVQAVRTRSNTAT